MRSFVLIVLALLAAPAAVATISVYQNDAGTGGDGGTWETHPAPLNNRHGGVAGAYSADMYHFIDEVDWYSFVLPSGTSEVSIAFTAQSDRACTRLAEGAHFTTTLIDPSGARRASVAVSPCYGSDTTSVPAPSAGKWIVSFALRHADPASVDVGVGPIPTSAPDSTATLVKYAFALSCDPAC